MADSEVDDVSDDAMDVGDAGPSKAPNAPMGDDEQNETERRHIRRQYRDLMDDIQKNKEDLINPSTDSLIEKLNLADSFYQPVKKTREAALDSNVLATIANLGRLKARALNTEFVKFHPAEFSEKLVTFVNGQQLREGQRITPEKWEKLGEAVQHMFKRAHPFQFMHGSFEPGELPAKRKPMERRKSKDKDVVGKATVPTQLQTFGEDEKNEATTAEVEKIHNILLEQYEIAERRPICYFEFVVNPKSFSQTVENIFYTSFLVRDGYVKIFLDDDKLPVIQPITEDSGNMEGNEDHPRKQVIISITKKMFRDICETFKIDDPLIPTRPPAYVPRIVTGKGKKPKSSG